MDTTQTQHNTTQTHNGLAGAIPIQFSANQFNLEKESLLVLAGLHTFGLRENFCELYGNVQFDKNELVPVQPVR